MRGRQPSTRIQGQAASLTRRRYVRLRRHSSPRIPLSVRSVIRWRIPVFGNKGRPLCLHAGSCKRPATPKPSLLEVTFTQNNAIKDRVSIGEEDYFRPF